MFKQACRRGHIRWAILVLLLGGCAAPHHTPLVLSPWTPPSSRPATLPTTHAAVSVSEMSVQTLQSQNFFFESTRVTALDVQKSIDRITGDLAQVANEGKVKFTGPCVFVFRGRSTELRRPFTLEIGFAVPDAIRPFGHFQLRKLPAFHCATVTFIGPGSLIDKAYDRLDPAVDAAGLRPTDEIREVYLRWEGPEFPNDQILVGVGVK